jgi:hypothetical protein
MVLVAVVVAVLKWGGNVPPAEGWKPVEPR